MTGAMTLISRRAIFEGLIVNALGTRPSLGRPASLPNQNRWQRTP